MVILQPLSASAIDWPQNVQTDKGTLVVYQPQPESLNGNVLKGRAAMSFELKDQAEPVFGAFWFNAKIDNNGDIALVRDIVVNEVRWPNSSTEDQQNFTDTASKALASSSFEISMARLSTSLELAEQEKHSLDNLNNDAPEIMFSTRLSVLLSYDGKPQYKKIDNSPYERVLNTPFAIARDTKSKKLYLSSGQYWYTATDPMGPWIATLFPPADLVAMVASEDDNLAKSLTNAPNIIAVDKPAELIATDGAPQWQSLIDGKLLYVNNTETAWVRETTSGDMYLLLSGRWFTSKKQAGPWTFVRADKLPASFKDIPPGSDIGGLRVSVAGTDEANQALMDAQIPQTTAIKRSEATLNVEYDGEPKFNAINGTQVSYAVNTAAQVLLINDVYYAVDNGVWFTAKSAKGPWIVADNIPNEAIAKIPATSPVYNTTYVQVYDSTPDVVYVGYTPGYLWSYPYYGVPVYGTGWYYPPYWGHYYYPRPPTWGLHIGYNPWTGWNVGVSWSNGFYRAGVTWHGSYGGYARPCCGGYYGGGHRRPVVINTGNINIGNTINIGNRNNSFNHITANKLTKNNLYNRPETRSRIANSAQLNKGLTKASYNKDRSNNIFADKHGNVARDNQGKWQYSNEGKWNTKNIADKATSASSAKMPKSSISQAKTQQLNNTNRVSTMKHQQTNRQRGGFDQQGLDRARSARQNGMTRENHSRVQKR
ncbi:carbohydrate-binding family V/XII [Shewanella sp. VB17]|nr:carbohydrate-binding family V/XII [Shewanella sp. VB17]